MRASAGLLDQLPVRAADRILHPDLLVQAEEYGDYCTTAGSARTVTASPDGFFGPNRKDGQLDEHFFDWQLAMGDSVHLHLGGPGFSTVSLSLVGRSQQILQ